MDRRETRQYMDQRRHLCVSHTRVLFDPSRHSPTGEGRSTLGSVFLLVRVTLAFVAPILVTILVANLARLSFALLDFFDALFVFS